MGVGEALDPRKAFGEESKGSGAQLPLGVGEAHTQYSPSGRDE